MNTLAKLIKKRKLGKICRVGTWIIAAIGAIHIISQSYYLWQDYRQSLAQQSFQEPAIYGPLSTIFLNYIPAILSSTALYLFYCIALYAASVVFDALGAPEAENKTDTEPDDEAIVYTPLTREEILQSKNHRPTGRV